MPFKDRQLNSMSFQACKMKSFNSMTFQVFHDLYEPCIYIFDLLLNGQKDFKFVPPPPPFTISILHTTSVRFSSRSIWNYCRSVFILLGIRHNRYFSFIKLDGHDIMIICTGKKVNTQQSEVCI